MKDRIKTAFGAIMLAVLFMALTFLLTLLVSAMMGV